MSRPTPNITVVPMPPEFDFGGFRSKPPGEDDELGEYVRSGDAARDAEHGFARTYLVYDDAKAFVGYYTLQADSIRLAGGEGDGDVPYRAAPAVKLARIGVNYTQQGRGLGSVILNRILVDAADVELGECSMRYDLGYANERP